MRKGLKLGDSSYAIRHVYLGFSAKMKNACLDTSVLTGRVQRLGEVVVSRGRCIVSIGLKIGYRGWFVR